MYVYLSVAALSIGQTVAIGVVVPILFITIGIVVLLVIIIVLVRKHSTRSRESAIFNTFVFILYVHL